MGPECKDPPDPSVDLYIVQLIGERTVGATGPRVHPYYGHPPSEWLNLVTDEGPQEVCTCQPGLEQLSNNIA
jgi:hypothetical protein